ncbi:DUF2254 domain-containing protein [Gordonia insulae]|uniref:DUF2254 domain-containing protein n=1 Tax=Gordonia insulae TaxID=2420509 RepID=A0A3G8JHG3_9ACTN|nr:DUF2254 domain-containing protein [Gordonia insulae]AZG44581.1 hypothetical protein D7316_01167 [Gordonia insulae]
MRHRLLRAANAFWFLPMALGIGALVLAQALITLDRAIDDTHLGIWGTVLYQVGASGSRDILGAIGGSMLAVAATSFSITVSVLATASSTYGPRLVRNFMNDRGNQFVLGIFGATFLYSLMVLRSIQDQTVTEGQFVPDIAVNVAVLLAVVDVAVLVYFINHIAGSIQVSTLSARVRSELVDVVDSLYPEAQPDDARPIAAPERESARVLSESSGFVLDIDEDALVEAASRADCLISVTVRPGYHIVAGEPLVLVRPPESAADVADTVRTAVALGDTRTPLHDVQFAVQQLIEMAVRALSPGTNDPYTAHNAFSELATGMVLMAQRPTPRLGRVDADDTVRVIITRVPVSELIDDIFEAVRVYALAAPVAMSAAIVLARRIGVAAVEPEVREAVLRHLALIEAAERRSDGDEITIGTCCGEIAEARKAIVGGG